MADEEIKITFSLPRWHYTLLKLWCYFKIKRGLAPMISDIVQNRIEANLDQIMLMLESRANDLGLTPEELKNKIINNNDTKD